MPAPAQSTSHLNIVQVVTTAIAMLLTLLAWPLVVAKFGGLF